MGIVHTVFCPTPIHACKQRQKKLKKLEKLKNHEFQIQNG